MLDITDRPKQLFIKSIGYGIFVAEIIPYVNDSKLITELVYKSGMLIQTIILDPNGGRAVFLTQSGTEPTKYERNQTDMSDLCLLELLRSTDVRLNDRFMLLKQSHETAILSQ